MNINTLSDIPKIIAKHNYNYVQARTTSAGLGGYNKTPKDLKKHIDLITKRIDAQGNGVYYLDFRFNHRGDIFTYQYNKGSIADIPAVQITPAHHVPLLEKFQTLDEWKRQEKRIAELEQEIALMNLQKSVLAESKPETNMLEKTKGFMTEILPTFLPVVDKYFALQERKMALAENKAQRKIISVKQSQRPINRNNDFITEYSKFFEGLTDDQAEKELIRLQTEDPGLAIYIQKKYFEETTD